MIPTSEAEKKMAERYAKRGLSYLANPFPKYEEPSTEPCYKRLAKERLGTAIGTEKLHIAFPVSQRLAGSDGTSVAVQMIDGRVQYLRFGTRGRFWQDEDLEIFKAKFGEPETVQPVALQNGFGARYTALEASWTPTSGLVARFESWVSDRAGNFEIGTPEAAKLFWDMPKQPTRAL